MYQEILNQKLGISDEKQITVRIKIILVNDAVAKLVC